MLGDCSQTSYGRVPTRNDYIPHLFFIYYLTSTNFIILFHRANPNHNLICWMEKQREWVVVLIGVVIINKLWKRCCVVFTRSSSAMSSGSALKRH